MAQDAIQGKMSLWLVTQPDKEHYILGSLSHEKPYRSFSEGNTESQDFDTWEIDEGVFILPITNASLPHYLHNHCWEDDPISVTSIFFPADTKEVTCKRYQDFSQCWRYNFSKSLLACSRCNGSSYKKLAIYKDYEKIQNDKRKKNNEKIVMFILPSFFQGYTSHNHQFFTFCEIT